MKDDKENSRPKDRRVELKSEEGEKTEKSMKEAMTKIVIRRLPPSLTKEELEEQLQPLPEVDYLEFFANDTSLFPHLFARAYINFKNQEDVMLFRDRFDGYVFIDGRGQEYPAIVEFAPFQKTAKRRSKKKDAKSGTIADDPDYKKFLEFYNGENEEKLTSTPETLLEELEAKSKELIAKRTTPLLDFLKNKQRIREEKKEERRRRELERKRLRDEERRKWREDERRKRKEAEKVKKSEKPAEKEKDEPKIKLLKKPERSEDAVGEKPKRADRASREERLGSDPKRRENREERGRWGDEDGRKEFRERDADREKERRLEEKRLRRRDENRQRKKERQQREKVFRKPAEDSTKEEFSERKKSDSAAESSYSEKPPRDGKKEESGKRERLRNKDRPAIQLYQPGARSRNRGGAGGAAEDSTDRKQDAEAEKAPEKGGD